MRTAWLLGLVVWVPMAVFAAEPAGETAAGRVPAGFRAAEGTKPEPYTGTGWAREVVHEKTGITMVFIPAGEFLMGTAEQEGQAVYPGEGPAHTVRITQPFYLGKDEVTVAAFRGFVEAAGYATAAEKGGGGRVGTDADSEQNEGVSWKESSFGPEPDQPVVFVSWDDAKAFCDWGGVRLPTEAEWECACRAGTQTAYSFGDGAGDLGRFAWYDQNSDGHPHAAGGKAGNAWGLHDMHGNVWEWCADWADQFYYAESPAENPRGPASGDRRVLRGGSWAHMAEVCRSAFRSGAPPAETFVDSIGFRVCVDVEPAPGSQTPTGAE